MVNRRVKPMPSSLFGFLTLLYVLFIVLVSLWPFTGWRLLSPDLLGYWFEPLSLKRLTYNKLDVLLNFLAYIPLGTLLVLSFRQNPFWVAFIVSMLLSGLLSVSMETLQSFLPARISNLFDVIWNVFGAFLGAMLMVSSRLRGQMADQILSWRLRFFESGRWIDLGLILLLLWFFVQWVPEGGLFSVGDIELLITWRALSSYETDFFVAAEAIICAVNMAAIGLISRFLFRSHWPKRWVFGIFCLALLVKTGGFMLYFGVKGALFWLTPGAKMGFLAGSLGFLLLSFLNRKWQLLIGGLLLILGVILANMVPVNPYVDDSIKNWRFGNYVGLATIARLVTVIWPFLMLTYLYSCYRRKVASPSAQ